MYTDELGVVFFKYRYGRGIADKSRQRIPEIGDSITKTKFNYIRTRLGNI